MKKMFFKWGIDLFDSKKIEYGGFNHFIAGKIFRWKFTYITIYLSKTFKFGYEHETDDCWYDGYHNVIWLGYIHISYGT